MSDVYVVEYGYDYEGNDAVWAGVDSEAAFRFADECTYGDIVRVTRFIDGNPCELWKRDGYSERPAEVTYERRVAQSGPQPRTSPWIVTDSIVRKLTAPTGADGGEG